MTTWNPTRDEKLRSLAAGALEVAAINPMPLGTTQLVLLATHAPRALEALIAEAQRPVPTEKFLQLESALGAVRMDEKRVKSFAASELGLDDNGRFTQFISRKSLQVQGFMDRELIIWQYAEHPHEKPEVQACISFAGEYHLPTVQDGDQKCTSLLLDLQILGYG